MLAVNQIGLWTLTKDLDGAQHVPEMFQGFYRQPLWLGFLIFVLDIQNESECPEQIFKSFIIVNITFYYYWKHAYKLWIWIKRFSEPCYHEN